jgi:hypothetical protein
MKFGRFSFSNTNRGQALILVAIAFVVLLAFVGLAIDAGQFFIAIGNLRKAADAGALAAAAQFREGRTIAEMQAAARDAISLNGVNPGQVIIELCDPLNPDPDLCPLPGQIPRKMVRVTAFSEVPLAFLSVIGFRTLQINATAVSEAASMDVVLVIDVSESMTFEGTGNMRDPFYCNSLDPGGADGYPGECQPFERVKEAAVNFITKILNDPVTEEQDRVAVVYFSAGWGLNNTGYATNGFTNNQATAVQAVKNLKTFEPGVCVDVTEPASPSPYSGVVGTVYWGPCRNYNMAAGEYAGLYCRSCLDHDEWSLFMTTNIGGGLRRAGNVFDPRSLGQPMREDALWVVVLLTDGLANATDPAPGDNPTEPSSYPIGFCPEDDTLCQDTNVRTRHADTSPEYDADDYARDMADFVGCFPTNQAATCTQEGQGAVIFSIGLGPEVLNNYDGKAPEEVNGIPYGVSLLRYVAAVGDDGDPDPNTDPCRDLYGGINEWRRWCGNYYYSPTGNQLNQVFEEIASRIFTRIAH